MKAGIFAVAVAVAAVASRVDAGRHLGRHAHEAFHMERALDAAAAPSTCGCTTIYTTITGEGTLYFPPPLATSSVMPTSSAAPVTTSSVVVVPSSSPAPVVPTPLATTCSTPGVYTIPATTVTLTSSTIVCAATSTPVSAGTYTVGGVTTVVSTPTTVVCPYAAVSTSSGIITSTILTTTYVCPSAGTYTIAPLTTTCVSSTVVVYPTPASYAPGTYTQPQVVTTITETDYVVFCPFTSPAPVAPASTSPAYIAPASTSPAYVAPASTSPAYVAPAKSSTPATPSSSSSSGLGSSGNQWAVTYSPYNNDGTCRDAGSVASDIAMIAAKGFSTVRIYSTDCSGLTNVGKACAASGLKMILGVFISSTGCSGAAQQITDIVAWGQWSLVELIVIGNEAIFSGYASGSDMASFISSSKATFQAAGYTGPCTTTEPLNILQENTGVLCAVMDIVGCNIHPFFNSDVDASSAGSFVASQLVIVDGLCAGKTGINLETGWPSSGTCNGVACPGTSEQATAVKGIQGAAGGKSVLFSFVNDMWKDPGSFDCEQSWGVIGLF